MQKYFVVMFLLAGVPAISESNQLNQFYVGSTKQSVDLRLDQHLTKYFSGSFTTKASDWFVFLAIECSSYPQALRIEKHIKNMKSRKYIENLKRYPEIIDKLLERYR